MSTNENLDQPSDSPQGGSSASDMGQDADSISDQVIQDLRSLSPDDPDGFLVEMIDLFQTDSAQYLSRIAASAKGSDASTLRKNAHGLKGSSGNLGAKKMSALCHQIEIAASEATPDWNKINPFITALGHEAARVRRAFDFLRNQAIRPK